MNFCGYNYLSISDEKKLFFMSNTKREQKRIKKNNLNKKTIKNNKKDTVKKDPNSPFAVLEKLL